MSTTTQPFVERAMCFDCKGDSLVAVIAAPVRPERTGVVVVVGGPQYRAGSHRQFVELARALAAGGHAVLRFDCRGMGDSTGSLRDFEAIDSDIAAAIDALLREQPSVRRVVLWGLCDGASAALMYVAATRDRRVSGLCLANPWLRTDIGQARTQIKHYYTRRLLERGFWTKLLSGKVAGSSIAGLWRQLRAAAVSQRTDANRSSYVRRMLEGWTVFDGPILLLCSGMDYTAREFIDTTQRDGAWSGALRKPLLQRVDFVKADHTFSSPSDAREAHTRTLQWLREAAASVAAESS